MHRQAMPPNLCPMSLTKPDQTERARRLRKSDTAAEQRLWEALRGRRLAGLKFVRQLPIGPYYADFVCRAKRLIIEVDGDTHSTEEEMAYDARRTAALERAGYRLIRVWNAEVRENLEGVLETIRLAAEGEA